MRAKQEASKGSRITWMLEATSPGCGKEPSEELGLVRGPNAALSRAHAGEGDGRKLL